MPVSTERGVETALLFYSRTALDSKYVSLKNLVYVLTKFFKK